jgi:hypothetical protein
MKLLALAELIPLVLMGAAAQAPPSCAEQRPAKEASVTAASGTLGNLSLYSTEELEVYQAHCEQELKAATDRGDNASAQRWASLRAAVIAEKQQTRDPCTADSEPDSEPDSTQDCHQEASLSSTGARIDSATHEGIDSAIDTGRVPSASRLAGWAKRVN